jgi:hypothetical protein
VFVQGHGRTWPSIAQALERQHARAVLDAVGEAGLRAHVVDPQTTKTPEAIDKLG